MDYGIGFFALAAVVVFLVGVSKSGIAAGFGALAVPALSLFVSPLVAAAIMLPLLSTIDVAVIYNYRRNTMYRYVAVLIPGAALGIGFGWITAGSFEPAWVKLGVALIALWFSALYYLKPVLPRIRMEMGLKIAIVFGAISGFTSFLAHAGGPPARAYLLSKHVGKSAYVGTMGTLFGFINALKMIPYISLGQLNADTFHLSLILSPFVVLGIICGIKLHHMISEELFTRLAYALLTFAGVKLAFDAIATLT